MGSTLTVEDVQQLYPRFEQSGLGIWIMGGWGVDALLGRRSRPHKDLDLLVRLADLAAFEHLVTGLGFTRRSEWEESRWITLDGQPFPTAYVTADPQGRELDIHVIDPRDDGTVHQLSDVPWFLTAASLAGEGQIGGLTVRCVSLAAQIDMHAGYDLPETHRHDLDVLRQWLRR